MKKLAVIGHFAFGQEYLDGQTVKTKTLTKALKAALGENAIYTVDTYHWSKKPLRFFAQVVSAARRSENVLILPAHNGLTVLAPLLSAVQGKCRLHYAVIGGWLPQMLLKKPRLKKHLEKFAGIYVETLTMKNALQQQGFENVEVIPNCKHLRVLEPQELPEIQKPYKLCTFSRVMQEKGIEDATAAVKTINDSCGSTVYELDIYGPVDPAQTDWFERVKKTFPQYIRYRGAVPYEKSVEVLKNYFALLFPTRFYTEGIPGTVIDAYAAGVPVISAKWESFADVIDDGVTGIGYCFGDVQSLQAVLEKAAVAPEMITDLRINCLKKAQEYLPEKAVEQLLQRMEG